MTVCVFTPAAVFIASITAGDTFAPDRLFNPLSLRSNCTGELFIMSVISASERFAFDILITELFVRVSGVCAWIREAAKSSDSIREKVLFIWVYYFTLLLLYLSGLTSHRLL